MGAFERSRWPPTLPTKVSAPTYEFTGFTRWKGQLRSVNVELGSEGWDEVPPQVWTSGWVFFFPHLGEGWGIDLLPRLSE